jgi:hypothetical protein
MLINKEEKIISLIKVIIILLNLINNNIKLILFIIKNDLKILISKTYKKVINNLNYN